MPAEGNLGGLGLSIPRPEWQGRQNLVASLKLGFPLGKMTGQAGLLGILCLSLSAVTQNETGPGDLSLAPSSM